MFDYNGVVRRRTTPYVAVPGVNAALHYRQRYHNLASSHTYDTYGRVCSNPVSAFKRLATSKLTSYRIVSYRIVE